VCYRAHDPRWSFTPTSGAGAAIHGGRFNPKGVEALYLALTLEGAFLEINQGFALKFAPCTLCSYDVDCDDLADLRTPEGRHLHAVDFDDMACAWFGLAAAGIIPPSWQMARRLMDEGFAGALVPSYAVGARADWANLVLWDWGDTLPHRVTVYDPNHQLPSNQRSWV
jgi:RES domain-containing protein